MGGAIDFDDEAQRGTMEIYDECVDRILAAELGAARFAASPRPEEPLGGGTAVTERTELRGLVGAPALAGQSGHIR